MKLIVFISFLMASVAVFAQYTEDLSKVRPTYSNEPSDSVKALTKKETADSSAFYLAAIAQNEEVDSLIDIMAEQNTKPPHNQDKGYRIQVYSGDNKQSAEEIEAQLRELAILEGTAVYKLFESGFIWRVKVGDFETRIDAYRVYKQLKNEFPNCLLVPERKINLN